MVNRVVTDKTPPDVGAIVDEKISGGGRYVNASR